jgi:capsular polysaccharide biosynthesis protein
LPSKVRTSLLNGPMTVPLCLHSPQLMVDLHEPRRGDPRDTLDLLRLVALARRRWLILALAGAAAAILAVAATGHGKAVYQSEARLLVGPIDTDFNEVRAAGQQAQTFAQLATSGAVLGATAHRLGPPATAAGLVPNVRAQADEVARLLTLTVRASRPDLATRANAALVTELQAFARSGGKTQHDLSVVDPPSPGLATGSGRSPLVALAAVAGLLTAFCLVVLAHMLRGRVVDAEELGAAAGLPVLGALSRRDRSPGRAFQALAARVQFAEGPAPRRAVLVETLEPQEPSGAIALELGRALAQAGGRVVLVDAASGRGTLTWRLGLEDRPGTSDLLPDAGAVHDLLVEDEPGLAILPSGRGPGPSPFEAGSPRKMLRRLAGRADVVVVSGPSPATSPHGLRWAQATDATILVATRWLSRRDVIAQGVDALEQVGAATLGVVLAERSRRVRLPHRRPPVGIPPLAPEEPVTREVSELRA